MAPAIQFLAFSLLIAFMATACAGDDGDNSKSDSSVLGGDGDGDGDGDRQCNLAGTYAVVLAQRDGNCGPVMPPTMITVPEQTSGILMHTEMQFGRNVVTTVVHKACSLRLTQEVTTSSGMLESSLNAGDLQLVSEGQLEGQATFQRFTPSTPQTVACQGVYEMTMVLRP